MKDDKSNSKIGNNKGNIEKRQKKAVWMSDETNCSSQVIVALKIKIFTQKLKLHLEAIQLKILQAKKNFKFWTKLKFIR